jgi:hypothetical protein
MAPKTKPARFAFAVGSIILAVVTWAMAMAQPLLLIYRPELLILY